MLAKRAEGGAVGRLTGLPLGRDFSIQGEGRFRIDEGCRPPRMIWVSKHSEAPDYSSARGGMVERALAMLKDSRTETSVECATGTEALDAYVPRLQYLQKEAKHDGYSLNRASEIDFKQFIRTTRNIRTCDLVLLDNGNLRAIWKDGRKAHLGLQFLGDKVGQYVIFKQRSGKLPVARVAGRDSLEAIGRQIDAFRLQSLIYE